MHDMNREKACAAVQMPASLSAELAGYEWGRDTVGASGGAVYRLHSKAHRPELFLKHGKDAIADDIADEMVRLRWLRGYVPVPAVVHFTRADDEAWLLMTPVPGKTAYQILEAYPERRTAVVDAIAAFLRQIHAIPISDCPFTSEHGYRLVRARTRIDAGLVDEDDFDDEREGWTAEQVWDAMQALLPLAPDPVVTHGDFSLDNMLIDGEAFACIDVGRAGIADRYQDLAIAWNCLAEFGAPLQQRFLEQYGVLEPDRHKLHFHLMLDELF
ncbi:APH(3')-I family aminoglycoside O-phosphotransferase [Janthinobacterium sp. SUN118]|uniref:APH(3')-I family aminoglycoside O-phosphotransferase n=1 Tax=Janthinobacterium sp. SUN118 TaxID=3004100 RepID=UPI0025B1FED5|nr:APH(3')-I family aminoglycoside O-phosphotransferase [Janthinobacterium sp. SUN118]MDN2709612.1 APH(3')-I family aminoglycoside O-phosphotransferase [Janthinobacterium sp. SUN118]